MFNSTLLASPAKSPLGTLLKCRWREAAKIRGKIVDKKRSLDRFFSKGETHFDRLLRTSPKPRILKSINHPVIRHLFKLSQSSSYRKYRGTVLLSSLKLIKEYCRNFQFCLRVYTTSRSNPALLSSEVRYDKAIILSRKLLQKISHLHSYCNGLLAEVYSPRPSSLGRPRLVLCVSPKAPRGDQGRIASLATLMRCAQALGWDSIFVVDRGSDLLDPVSIRASQNCLATMPFKRGSAQEAVELARKAGLLICHCSSEGSDVKQLDLAPYQGVMLLAGQQPRTLTSLSTSLTVEYHSKRFYDARDEVEKLPLAGAAKLEGGKPGAHYRLDETTLTAIAMYLIRRIV